MIPNSEIKEHVIVAFVKRNDIIMRMRQRNRKQSKECFRPDLLKLDAYVWYVAEMTNRMMKNGEDFDLSNVSTSIKVHFHSL